MAAQIEQATITNISPQVVRIMYGRTDAAHSVSAYKYTDHGTLELQPGAHTTIESIRLDLEQLNRLRDLKLITYILA